MFSLSKILKKPSALLSTLALISIIGYSIFLILGMIKPGHDWGGDFALYINQCVHLSHGSIAQLHKQNTFAMQHSLYEIGPYLYPQGFPILLLPVYWLFGISLYKMKIYCALFFIASLFLFYKLIRPLFSTSIIPLIIIAMLGFSFHFIEMTDAVLSEFPFIFFVLLSFWLLQKERTVRNQVLAGAVIFFTYLIRDIGICLLGVLIFDYFFKYKKMKEFRFYGFLPFISFAVLFIISKIIFPNGGANHQAMFLQDLGWLRFETNAAYYTELLSNIFLIDDMQEHIGNKILLVVFMGAIISFKKTYPYLIFLLGYCIILLIWPSQESFRFLLPILGFIFLFLGLTIEKIGKKIKIPTAMLALTLLFLLYPFFAANISKTKQIQSWRRNEARTEEMKNIYSYIQNEIEKDQIIGFMKPRVLTLFSGQPSVFIDLNSFDTSVANYMLVPKNLADPSRKNEFNQVEDFINFYLLAKNKTTNSRIYSK